MLTLPPDSTITMVSTSGATIPSGEEVIRQMRKKSSKVLLGMSTGKDSVGAWLALREHFDEIIPYYLYLVPDLEFVDEALAYYEKFFGKRIIRIPHPSLYRLLRNHVFQTPVRVSVINRCELPSVDYTHLIGLLREDLNLSENVYDAAGVRVTDTLVRRTAIKRYGPINHNRHTFWPIWDWRKAALVRAFRRPPAGGLRVVRALIRWHQVSVSGSA